MEEKPFFEFEGLKQLLTSLGYQIKKATSYREVENVDVDLNDLETNIEFTNDGIFLIDSKTNARQQIFLYKLKYRLLQYGKPRFHICKCKTINEYIEGGTFKKEYRRANTAQVKVLDMDDGYKEKKIIDLPLCQNCIDFLKNDFKNKYKGIRKSSEFVNKLKEMQKNIEVDIYGYTKNWELISEDFRESKNYTCNRCKLHISNPFHYFYMHTHHLNGDKLNNNASNLECLCIRCHSRVDEIHKRNFSRGANQIMLQQFNEEYPEKDCTDTETDNKLYN